MELAPELVFREFRGTPGEPAAGGGLASSADGRFLLTVQPQLRLYDTGRGEEVGILNLPFATAKQAFFENDGSAVFYSCLGKGIYRRDFAGFTNALDGSVSVRWGEEKQVARHPNAIIWNSIEAGETWVRHGTDGVELWPHRDPGQARKLEVRAPLKSLATSQNARWAAAPNGAGRGVTVWDCETGRVVTNLPARVPDQVWFSPDSRWLVASVAGGYDTWETGSWKRGARSEARLDSGDPGEVTFSANSRLIAVRQEREIFRLMSFPDCRELVTLKPPLVVPVRSSCLSPDGTRLWLLAPGYRLFEWNLAGLRAELAKLDLNWGQEAEPVNR
jgi:hypothetical protein